MEHPDMHDVIQLYQMQIGLLSSSQRDKLYQAYDQGMSPFVIGCAILRTSQERRRRNMRGQHKRISFNYLWGIIQDWFNHGITDKLLFVLIGRDSSGQELLRMEVTMLKLIQGGRFSAATINTNKENRQQKDSSRSWMIKYGIRRYFSTAAPKCPHCGEILTKTYRLHPFVLPKQFGRGLWLTTDCRCETDQTAGRAPEAGANQC